MANKTITVGQLRLALLDVKNQDAIVIVETKTKTEGVPIVLQNFFLAYYLIENQSKHEVYLKIKDPSGDPEIIDIS